MIIKQHTITYFRWIVKVAEALNYVSDGTIRIYDSIGFMEGKKATTIWACTSRFGIFVYALLVPLLLLWRQKSFRQEFIAMFKDARTMATEFTSAMLDTIPGD